MKKGWTTMINRWKAESPKIFRRVMQWSIGITGAIVAAYTAMVTAGVDIPDWMQSLYPYAVGFGGGVAFLAKFTKIDNSKDEEI